MINANELRIGNWMLYPHTQKEPFLISEPRHIGLADICFPIQLTPKILEACGFKDSPEFGTWTLGQIDIESLRGGWRWTIDDLPFNEGSRQREIKYLHQLQNLYFAITGTELPISDLSLLLPTTPAPSD